MRLRTNCKKTDTTNPSLGFRCKIALVNADKQSVLSFVNLCSVHVYLTLQQQSFVLAHFDKEVCYDRWF